MKHTPTTFANLGEVAKEFNATHIILVDNSRLTTPQIIELMDEPIILPELEDDEDPTAVELFTEMCPTCVFDSMAAVRLILMMKTGSMRRPSNDDVLEFIMDHPDFDSHAREWNQRCRWPRGGEVGVGISYGMALAWVLPEYHRNIFRHFLAGVFSDVADHGNPAYELRALLAATREAGVPHNRVTTLARYIKAWNAFLLGSTTVAVDWDRKTEELPTIEGMKS